MKSLSDSPIYVPARECMRCYRRGRTSNECPACNGTGQLPAVLVAREPVSEAEWMRWLASDGPADGPTANEDYLRWAFERDAGPCECVDLIDACDLVSCDLCEYPKRRRFVVWVPCPCCYAHGRETELTVVEYIAATEEMLAAAGIEATDGALFVAGRLVA